MTRRNRRLPRRTTIPPIAYKLVRLRDRNRCRYCGRQGSNIDHVNPKANGGSNDAMYNLVVACGECNQTKGREVGFELLKGRLYWHGRIVAPGHLFGEPLMDEIRAQRLARQKQQGLAIAKYKEEVLNEKPV